MSAFSIYEDYPESTLFLDRTEEIGTNTRSFLFVFRDKEKVDMPVTARLAPMTEKEVLQFYVDVTKLLFGENQEFVEFVEANLPKRLAL